MYILHNSTLRIFSLRFFLFSKNTTNANTLVFGFNNILLICVMVDVENVFFIHNFTCFMNTLLIFKFVFIIDSIREIWQSWVLGIKGTNCFKLCCPRLVIIISGSTRAAQIWRYHKQTFRTLGRAPLSANYKAGFQQRLYSYA